MFHVRSLKSPFVLIPLLAGILIPSIAFLVLHFSSRANSQSKLILEDAVVISGVPLPQTELINLEGRVVSPELLRKGKVLLVFLTTDCSACQNELQLLSNVESDISNSVSIYGIGVEDRIRITSFIQANGLQTKILVDENAKLMKTLNVKYFPTKFLVQDGVIVKTWFGNSPDRAELLKDLGL